MSILIRLYSFIAGFESVPVCLILWNRFAKTLKPYPHKHNECYKSECYVVVICHCLHVSIDCPHMYMLSLSLKIVLNNSVKTSVF